jgi:hypothetical protein
MPQNWLFLKSYKKQREHLLKDATWNLMTRLGEGGFDSSQAAGAFTILLTLTHARPDAAHTLHGLDASAPRTVQEKAALLREGEVVAVNQAGQLRNPDSRVVLERRVQGDLLAKYADSYQGISPADAPRFGKFFWEGWADGEWCRWQSTVGQTFNFGGREHILWLSAVRKKVDEEGTAYIRGTESWGKRAVVVSAMRKLPVTLGAGEPSDTNVAVVIPKNPHHLPAIWCYCSSPEFREAVRRIDQKLNVTNATLVKVPFDLSYWQQIATEHYPTSLPKPYSDEPTQWIFHGHPKPSTAPLQIAVARLLGYRWPAERDQEMELSDEARAWITRAQGLNDYADEDGIVCLPAVRGEPPAADGSFTRAPNGGLGGWLVTQHPRSAS